ncbi:MAG TPA: hypothetical protein VF278_06960 [Pirellulales bacterium]
MENPYQAPQSIGAQSPASRGGFARQVPIVAILFTVQGGLEILMGGMFFFLGLMTAIYARQEGVNSGLAMSGVYSAMGLAGFAVGVLHAVAGWRNYSYHNRWLGISASIARLGSLFTCYCFPTAFALMIYGLIVYLNSQTARAFELGTQGLPREQIASAIDSEEI